MRSRQWLAIASAGALALGIAACGDSSSSSDDVSETIKSGPKGGTINGAGATFPEPVYNEWAARFQSATETTVNYQGIGSGGGIAQFTAGTVDFGATDSPMDDEEQAAAEKKGTPVHVPAVFGSITVSYNQPGIETGLKLDGATMADIFLGDINKWNDPAIAKLNPDVELPDADITVIHRSDESGTTGNFTKFLAEESPAWESGPGADKTVKWPTGTGAKGNDGVAAAIKQTEGSIGYVELAFALQNSFPTASVENKAGEFVVPNLESTTAAGEGLTLPEDLRFETVNASKNPGAYPISTATFLLVYEDQCKAGKDKNVAERVKNWLDYGLGDGQKVAPELEYAPLPKDILDPTLAAVAKLTCDGQPLSGGDSASK